MAAVVSFMNAGSAGAGAGAVSRVRKMEILTIPSTSTITGQSGEIAIILNTETAGILVAVGSTPDAAAVTDTSATTAGQGVPAGLTSPPIILQFGDKVSVKAIP
jgi:hypothetical protein